MTRLDALRALLEQVEAGTATGDPNGWAVPREQSQLITLALGDDDEIWANFVAAHDGSIDAAKALHEVVLPGWNFSVFRNIASVSQTALHDVGYLTAEHIGEADNPARAWLLAILRALLEERVNETADR